jgi:hypothetical protein
VKPPHWLVIESIEPQPNGHSAVFTVRVRRWHPMYWVAFVRAVPAVLARRRRAVRVAKAMRK